MRILSFRLLALLLHLLLRSGFLHSLLAHRKFHLFFFLRFHLFSHLVCFVLHHIRLPVLSLLQRIFGLCLLLWAYCLRHRLCPNALTLYVLLLRDA